MSFKGTARSEASQGGGQPDTCVPVRRRRAVVKVEPNVGLAKDVRGEVDLDELVPHGLVVVVVNDALVLFARAVARAIADHIRVLEAGCSECGRDNESAARRALCGQKKLGMASTEVQRQGRTRRDDNRP